MMPPSAIHGRRAAARPWQRLVAAAGVSVVLALTLLAVCPTLHAWLHGEKHLDPEDDCAVVLFAQGVTPGLAILVLLALVLIRRDVKPAPLAVIVEAPAFALPPVCGPPLG